MTDASAEPVNRRTYTVVEAARILGISRSAAYRAAARGELPSLKVGHRLVVPAARLHELLGEAGS